MHAVISASADSRLKRVQWEADAGIRLDLLGFVSFPEGHRGTLHAHPHWELIYISSGAGFLQRGSVERPCAAGDILLVKPGERHQFRTAGEVPFDQLYVGFSFDFAAQDSQSAPGCLPEGPLTDLIRAELRENLDALKAVRAGQFPDSVRGRLLAIIGRVIGLLAANGDKAHEVPRRHAESMVLMAREFLQANLKGKLEVPELARRFCLSPQYFGELFKKDTGLTVKEYQRHCRMDKAMAMLRESALSVTEIAESVGLEDLAYFSRLFKKTYGIAPRSVRTGQAQAVAA
jgi:AraC-like DNA-binding protein/mannose-6-phosphate isomerase-like protein (cupin superfamily)